MSDAKDQRSTIKCPTCGKPSAAMSTEPGVRSPYPFCSDRCKLRDLGKWLD
ncbi:MAG: DNA gyrase inhibitor YacG, partial [Planctomycetota bacterium]